MNLSMRTLSVTQVNGSTRDLSSKEICSEMSAENIQPNTISRELSILVFGRSYK